MWKISVDLWNYWKFRKMWKIREALKKSYVVLTLNKNPVKAEFYFERRKIIFWLFQQNLLLSWEKKDINQTFFFIFSTFFFFHYEFQFLSWKTLIYMSQKNPYIDFKRCNLMYIFFYNNSEKVYVNGSRLTLVCNIHLLKKRKKVDYHKSCNE